MILLVCAVMLCGGCESVGRREMRSAVTAVKSRDAVAESEAFFKEGRVVFFAVGSMLEGYALPGLTEEEVAFLQTQPHEMVNEFPTDPSPFFTSQEYWDAVNRFASAYNRLVYHHLTAKTQK